jgi:hypothetical protein
MSEIIFNPTVAGIELSTHEQSNPVVPTWLAEALLLGEYWRTTGLFDRLQTQVRVNRGRMGQYEVCDFVLLLLAYAVSGLQTLEDFFVALSPVKEVLMSVWQRQQCPVASTLSRFLGDIDPSALEQLRTLFETDLWTHGFDRTRNGGLIDRAGEHFWVFDIDGTHQVARQRTLTQHPEYPQARRRSQSANAPGYLGRKRGDVTRTRTTVAQTHSSEWLGTFGTPGNGTPGADLQRACGLIQNYLHHHHLAGQCALVRLDGFYGTSAFVNQMQQHQLGYLLRCRDYQLLKQEAIQKRLQQTPAQEWSHPEAHQAREVFDIGFVDDAWAGYSQAVRLIVVRTPYDPKRKHRVGKRLGEFIYELFITSHPQTGLSGSDLLSLYYGRGGFEKQLGDEDQEQTCDRWCSWHPLGQEFWQILNQWLWNWRLWAGFADHPQPLRQTIWLPNLEASPAPQLTQTSVEQPLVVSEVNSPCPPADSSEHDVMQIAGSWARSRGKFSGDDFTLLNERTLQCPAGNLMYRREVRQNRLGDLLILFGINPRTCQQCPLKEQCLAEGSKGTGGRRITVIRKKLPAAADQPQPIVPPQPMAVMPPQPIPVPPPLLPPSLPVLWLDFPTTRLRRDLNHQLRQQQLIIEPIMGIDLNTEVDTPFITRDQRAHRRLTWADRWQRNAIANSAIHWRVKLFGISSAILDWINSLKPSPDLII